MNRLSAWLLLGVVATALSANRWGIPALTWVATVPFLVAAGRASLRGWGAIAVAVTLAQVLATVKIVTAPLPLAMAFPFALPMAVGAVVLLAVWRLVRDRVGPGAAMVAWPALIAVSDWSGYTLTPLSAWTSSANGLTTDPMWMQLTALGGMALVGALVGLVGAWLATAVLDGPRRWAPQGVLVGGLALAGALYGTLRLDARLEPGPTVRVAAVTTELGLGADGLPSREALSANTESLFRRSSLAAERGAQVVVWNEAATIVWPEEEAALLEKGASFARSRGVELVLAYGVPVSDAPLLLRNELTWFGPDGAVLQRYAKHHPVPGEPSVQGEGPLLALARPWGTAGVAICYDLDFPATARTYASQGAGVVLVPSSDWRGIDPLHTQMAGVRAIESGVSVVRPVRAAASAAFDPAGRVRGWMAAKDPEGVMVADVPTTPVATFYARYGDTPVLVLAGIVLAGVLGRALLGRAPVVLALGRDA